jgi:valine--pyruvate aminotransferase
MSRNLSAIGQKMSELTGVRSIMKDIQESLKAHNSAELINMSAGNPLILPEVDALWRSYTQEILETNEFSEVVGRYGSSQGYEPLIEAVVSWFNQEYNWGITAKNVLITPGSQALYFIAANAFTGYNGQVHKSLLLPICPDYTGYGGVVLDRNVIKSYKPTIDILSEHRFKYRPNFEQLQIDETVGAVLFSRPCNPSGNVITDEEVQQIVAMCQKQNVPVLIDSAYAPPFPNMVFTDMTPIWNENVIHCISLSKTGLPGERVGIAIGSEDYIQVLESFQSNMNIHSSRFGQAIAAKAIQSGELSRLSNTVIKPFYESKLRYFEDALDRLMPDNVPWYLHKGEGSLFVWLWFKDLPISDAELYTRLKNDRVIVVPGSSFFIGLDEEWSHRNECIRISLTASEAEMEQGVMTIANTLRQLYKG